MKEKANISIDYLGNSRLPLLIIDNGTSSLEKLKNAAVSDGDFVPDNLTMYPGLRSALPSDYVYACLKPLMPYLYKIFKIPQNLKPAIHRNYFSLVTTEESNLEPVQSFPHFDSNKPYLISVIHYLNPGQFGGTGFFRHKQTQYEYIDGFRRNTYLDSVEKYLNENMNKSLRYCDHNHPEFEMYKSIAYQEDRMVVFNGYMLHSALITKQDVNASPVSGRLTANIFIEFV